MECFGQQVEQLSQGTIRIKAVFNAVDDAANFELATIELIEKRTLDLGWVGARAWDTQGVLSFQALQAPFLITSYRL